jgi:hypothetical protein
MNVTGMVVHGHRDGAYAHYSPDCWLDNSNETISSIARLFRRILQPPICEMRDLFLFPLANSLFEALMQEKSRYVDAFSHITLEKCHYAVPLAKKLYL